ncbi:MAG: hypothetical protein ACFB10_23870 [Salibacteraceae bacterium]
MKKLLLLPLLVCLFSIDLYAQVEYKVVTVVESIVPGGAGRSRIIEATDQADSEAATTARTDGKKSDMSNVKRGDLKVDQFEETKLLNFFSLGGINFQNIASNDALVTDKINKLAEEGWELAFVTSGVESNSGEKDGEGIFVTRLVFKRMKG